MIANEYYEGEIAQPVDQHRQVNIYQAYLDQLMLELVIEQQNMHIKDADDAS